MSARRSCPASSGNAYGVEQVGTGTVPSFPAFQHGNVEEGQRVFLLPIGNFFMLGLQ